MKKEAKFFREAAWSQLKGHWEPAVLFTLVYVIIAFVAEFIGSKSDLFNILISLLVLVPLGYGFNVAFLDFKRTGAPLKIEEMFDGFKDYGRVLTTKVLEAIYIVLWSLLLFIPGIIKAISYSQTDYILKDYPELKHNEAIALSMAMMKAHKFHYFYLTLTFIGWFFLGILTLGIGLLWVNPYYATASAHFYEYVKEDYERRLLE